MKKAYYLRRRLYTLDLSIGGTSVRMQSRFLPLDLMKNPPRPPDTRLKNFATRHVRRPDVLIDVSVSAKLPRPPRAKTFTTFHPEDNKENWSLSRVKTGYVFSCPLEGKEQLLYISKDLSRVGAIMQAKACGGAVWDALDLVYDFLQILLIYRLALRGQGLVLHACALCDTDGSGYLFAGKSGVGKSTTATLWHKNSRAKVLNDDRILVLKKGRGYVMLNPPWHGEVGDRLPCCTEVVRLKKIFFLGRGKRNSCARLAFSQAFGRFYPCFFPPSWDKQALASSLKLGEELLARVPSYDLKFVKNAKVIEFIREQTR